MNKKRLTDEQEQLLEFIPTDFESTIINKLVLGAFIYCSLCEKERGGDIFTVGRKSIEDMTGYKKSNISKAIQYLIAHGYIERVNVGNGLQHRNSAYRVIENGRIGIQNGHIAFQNGRIGDLKMDVLGSIENQSVENGRIGVIQNGHIEIGRIENFKMDTNYNYNSNNNYNNNDNTNYKDNNNKNYKNNYNMENIEKIKEDIKHELTEVFTVQIEKMRKQMQMEIDRLNNRLDKAAMVVKELKRELEYSKGNNATSTDERKETSIIPTDERKETSKVIPTVKQETPCTVIETPTMENIGKTIVRTAYGDRDINEHAYKMLEQFKEMENIDAMRMEYFKLSNKFRKDIEHFTTDDAQRFISIIPTVRDMAIKNKYNRFAYSDTKQLNADRENDIESALLEFIQAQGNTIQAQKKENNIIPTDERKETPCEVIPTDDEETTPSDAENINKIKSDIAHGFENDWECDGIQSTTDVEAVFAELGI